MSRIKLGILIIDSSSQKFSSKLVGNGMLGSFGIAVYSVKTPKRKSTYTCLTVEIQGGG